MTYRAREALLSLEYLFRSGIIVPLIAVLCPPRGPRRETFTDPHKQRPHDQHTSNCDSDAGLHDGPHDKFDAWLDVGGVELDTRHLHNSCDARTNCQPAQGEDGHGRQFGARWHLECLDHWDW